MSSHLVRRGGIWWTRLAVPIRLRVAAGRREFIQSCRTHELAIAKLVAAVLLADWRKQLLQLDSRQMSVDVLKLVGGSPILSGGGWVPLVEAVSLSGINQAQLLRAATDGALKLFCRVSQVRGYVVALDALEPIDARAGRSGGVEIPPPQFMPASALEGSRTGVLPLCDSAIVAAAVLADGLQSVDIVGFEVPEQPGEIFAPDTVVTVEVGALEVLAAEVEAVRQRLAKGVSPEAAERARELHKTALLGSPHPGGKKEHKRFSEALEAYAAAPSGIPGSVTSLVEQKQKRRGCSLFIELVGDLLLSEITADRLREFRQTLKTLPAKVNNIPKAYRRETMAATVEALHDGGVKWPTMTVTARHERLLWVGQMFTWLTAQGWVTENPTMAVLGEQTQTAAARKAQRQQAAARAATDDDDDRRAFTPDELKLIFSQAHYRTGHGAHVKGNARWYPFEFWLPLIGLFAGCRIGEICQLRLDDIRQSEDGTWYFDINETTPDKSLKNANAVRQIPVSPVLAELGLIAYRDRLLKEGYKRLFAELTYAKSDARYAKEPIRKMSAMLGALGMPRDSTRVFHCLRANFNDAMLRVPFTELPFDDPDLKRFIRLKVIGHKLEGVNENHYSSTTMTEKFALVKGVQYDLPKISMFDIEYAVKAVRNGLENKKGPRRGVEDMGPPN